MALFTIDRTINFDEQKVKKVIQIIRDANSVEDIENKMIEHGIVSLRENTEPHGFFRRRWSTFLKEFGVYDGQNLTEMANLYVNDELTSKEFILLFLIDRVMENERFLIRPLEVLLKVLLLLKQNNASPLITENELKFVINRVNGSEESIVKAVNVILNNRNHGISYNISESVQPCHYDIWRNLLKTAGLNDENSNYININLELPIVKKILEYYSNSNPNNEENYKFDSKFVGFIDLPKKANENDEILLRRQNYQAYYSEIIYSYLFETSINNIERNILNANENGNIPYRILNGFNISTNRNDNPSNMRLYYPFKGYEGIIINKLRKTGDTIYSFIGSSIRSYLDDSFNVDNSNDLSNNDTEEEVDDIMSNEIISIDSPRLDGGYNKIVYGIPGCGKSYYVENEIIGKDPLKGGVFRTTFYPDYTNGDFVGQVIPKLNSKDETSILYDIQSGSFADAILNAILNPDKYTYLIIEEINRGNAAAIFGDMFQLLDRKNGISEYPVKNYIISTFLHKSIDNKYYVDYDLDNIKIPSNLILIGTMNTSDQNVFTLDTAFKRRWKMEYIKNDIFNSKYANYKIPMSDVTWAEFVKEINDYITGENGLDINGEDKQIGAYFISSSEWDDIITTSNPKEAAKIFAEKILSYIWDDVAKINRDSWFDSNKYRTLDSIVTAFSEKGLEVFGDNISFTRDSDNRE